jgi:alkylmercury lyase
MSENVADGLDWLDWLGVPLLRMLARGGPVGVGELATEVGAGVEEVRRVLAGQCDIEFDDAGRIIGSGITLRPTPHSFEVDGRRLYTWCALDTLVFPAMLGKSAIVESSCRATRTAIRIHVEPDRVVSVEPADAVVSIVAVSDSHAIRSSFCDHVHFFANAGAATDWLAEHPDATVVPVADAQQVGRPVIQGLVGGSAGDCC